MNDIKFSVIVPIYKVEAYLRECIDSVINQTYSNWELILVDDGSPDNCPAICDEYASRDERIIVIHKTNGGLVSARKAGAIVATGDYVVCLDGDDALTINALEKYNEIICSYNAPDIICAGHFSKRENESFQFELPYRKGLYSRKQIEKEIFPILIQSERAEYFAPSVWAKAFKKNIYEKYQMMVDNSFTIGEDAACTIPIIFYSQSMFITDEYLYTYRINIYSMTRNSSEYSEKYPVLLYGYLKSLLSSDEYDIENQLRRRVVHDVFVVCVSVARTNNRIATKMDKISRLVNGNLVQQALDKAHFLGRAVIMKIAVKYKIFLIFKIYTYRKIVN